MAVTQDSDSQLIDSIEDITRLSDRHLAERTLRATERVEMYLGELCARLAPPDTPPGTEQRI